MTTVTEAVKHVPRRELDRAIEAGDLDRLCGSVELAREFAERLTAAANAISPGRRWTKDDLRDVLEVALRGVPVRGGARFVEGRHLRKCLREQTLFAERYGDPFAMIVVKVAPDAAEEIYDSVLDAVTDRLRRTDLVFLYRRRFALVLPHTREELAMALLVRMRELLTVGIGAGAVLEINVLSYPNARYPDASSVLDWAEDELR